MMSRRDCLVRIFGAAVAAAVAPLVDLTDRTPAFWNQPALKDLMPWRIKFPDGTTFSFNATVTAEELLADGTINLTLHTGGRMKIDQDTSPAEAYANEPETDSVTEIGPPSGPASATVIQSGTRVMEVQDIMSAEFSREPIGYDDENRPIGVIRRSDITFTVKL